MPFSNLLLLSIVLIGLVILVLFFFRKREIKLKHGDNEISLGKSIEKKIDDLRKIEVDDKSLQMELYRHSLKVDEKCKSDMKRKIRNLDDSIMAILEDTLSCDFASLSLLHIIQNELTQRVDENNLREKLSNEYIEGYFEDICYHIETRYMLYSGRKTKCDVVVPSWKEIEKDVRSVISEWICDVRKILADSLESKIEYYKVFEESFKTAEYKKSAVLIPIKKNQNYLSVLQGTYSL